MGLIDRLIGDAKEIIKADRGKRVKPTFEAVEKFLAEHRIPVKPTYEPNDFWKYEAYPMHGFSNLAVIIRDEFISNLDTQETITLYNYVYKYIYRIMMGRYPLATFTNIFGSGQNPKYQFATYEGPARLNKELTMLYIHPKYVLEELLREMYRISNYEHISSLSDRKKELLAEWMKLTPEVDFMTPMPKPEESFKKDQVRLIKKIEKKLISADYDPNIPVYIGSSQDIRECEQIARDMFPALEVSRNASKSFFDPRTINHIFKNGKHILIKVWELLDHEIIPIVPQMKLMTAHISVILKLALTEHITYDILGFNEIAKEKLEIFTYVLQREKDLRSKNICISLLACKSIGVNYPVDKYIANMRASNAAKFSNNKK